MFFYLFSILLFYFIFINNYQDQTIWNNVNIYFYSLIDNFYESLTNHNNNDLFGFLVSYYLLNSVELLIIGFLLLIGSVICINFNQNNKTIGLQNYNNFLKVFNFFKDFITFFFLRKQNFINQGFTTATLKVFKKK